MIAPSQKATQQQTKTYNSQLVLKTIYDHVHDKKDVPAHVQMDLVRVSKENLGAWARQLRAWGFTDVDPKFVAMK